jgi:hypothetical protein
MSDESDFLSREKFMRALWSYKRGSISRRHFLGVTGLGVATAVLGAAMPGLRPRRALAQGSIGDRVVLATWPNYHDPATSTPLPSHRRAGPGERLRLERRDAGQASGRRQRLGRVRADQLHDHDLCR